MNIDQLYKLMEGSAEMSELTLVELKNIIDRYPYFQAARNLYLKNLAMLNHPSFLSELRKASIFIHDRKKLFTYIEGEKFGLFITPTKSKEVSQNKFELINSFLSSYGNNEDLDIAKILPYGGITSDYTQTLTGIQNSTEQNTKQLHRQDLIDSFIVEDSKRERVGLLEPSDNSSKDSTALDQNNDFLSSNDEPPFSETLARIYVKQKRYEKAVQIIQKLSLKYPEKNVYFADQIRFLEKLIINNKK